MAKTMDKTPTPNWENRALFHGDNLEVLRGMNSETVDLIATDPPFNKGRDFHATPDSLASGACFQDRWSWEKDVHPSWLVKLENEWERVASVITLTRQGYGEDMAAYLCFMAVRLIEMHRVLKPTGSIYLHCDATASHYLKILLDAIFGKKNFRNDIVWQRIKAGKQSQFKPRSFGSNSESLLFYTKGNDYYFNPYRPLTGEEILEKFNKMDDSGQRYYDDSAHIFRSQALGKRPNLCYTWRGFKNRHPSGWVMSKERLEEEYKKGNFVIREDGKLERRKYEKDYSGHIFNNLWLDVKPAAGERRTGYPTQKPLLLYQRIIKSSSNKGDIVLDPFCGCATTLVAAEMEGREWVGIDIWDKAYEVVMDRLEKEGLLKIKTSKKKKNLAFGDVDYTKELPERTDDKKEAVPFLRPKEVIDEPKGKKMSRVEMLAHLIKQRGSKCQGCNRVFDDERYLELDHNTPRSDGGMDHIRNMVLLCGPCNKSKSNMLTLSGLRKKNKKEGYMQDEA